MSTATNILHIYSMGEDPRVEGVNGALRKWNGMRPETFFHYAVTNASSSLPNAVAQSRLAKLGFAQPATRFGFSRSQLFQDWYPPKDGKVSKRYEKDAVNLFHVVKTQVNQYLSSLMPNPANFELLQYVEGIYYLSPELNILSDLQEFQRAVAVAMAFEETDSWKKADVETQINVWKDATDLYGGEFLPLYDQPWIVKKRIELANMQVNALFRLARLYRLHAEFDQDNQTLFRAHKVLNDSGIVPYENNREYKKLITLLGPEEYAS